MEFCVVFSFNRTLHIAIKGIAIWGVWRADVRDVIAEIFLQPRLDSPAWSIVLLSDVGSSSGQPVDQKLHNPFQALYVGLRDEAEVKWEDE